MLTSVCGPVDDGSDRRLYPSPIKKAERPIDKILLAYHAVANMVLFYRQCAENGHAVERCHAQAQQLAAWRDALRAPLEGNAALTDVGRAFLL
ncbi:MAG: hypothetical protein KC503_11935, partial [Myxococcales bacterium]|nr:hypothetical protein [Myxococcales bacterium]